MFFLRRRHEHHAVRRYGRVVLGVRVEAFAKVGSKILHLDTQANFRWSPEIEIPIKYCRGNLSFLSNSEVLSTQVESWSWKGDRHHAPRCLADIHESDFGDIVAKAHSEAEIEWLTKAMFPIACVAEDLLEAEDKKDYIDDASDDPATQLPEGVEEMLLKEEEILEQIPMPGVPGHEETRRKVWLDLPRRARVAIRKMHQEWGHMPKTVMINIRKRRKHLTSS